MWVPSLPKQSRNDSRSADLRSSAISAGFYAIADVCAARLAGLSVETFAKRLLSAQPAALQIRAKRATARDVVAAVSALRDLCRRSRVPLIVNDRADLAEAGGADGVHVGQSDMSVHEVRRHFPRLLVGVSTHSLAQLRQALMEKPDYVAFGPIFPTSTKQDAEPALGLHTLSEASKLASSVGVPVVAIGGIDPKSAIEVYKFVPLIAAIGATLARGSSEAAIVKAVGELSP